MCYNSLYSKTIEPCSKSGAYIKSVYLQTIPRLRPAVSLYIKPYALRNLYLRIRVRFHPFYCVRRCHGCSRASLLLQMAKHSLRQIAYGEWLKEQVKYISYCGGVYRIAAGFMG